MKRMLFHIHTRFSYDSFNRPESIVDYAVKSNIDCVVITDHDTNEGALAAKAYTVDNNINITIPVAAEYLTDIGDIIVINIPADFNAPFEHKALCRQAKDYGAVIVLPHPYHQHHLDRIDFDLIDYVEIFNARCSIEENKKAEQLAKDKNLKTIYGADAHSMGEVVHVINGIDEIDFTDNFVPIKLSYASQYSYILSQYVKAVKNKDLKLLLYVSYKLIRRLPMLKRPSEA